MTLDECLSGYTHSRMEVDNPFYIELIEKPIFSRKCIELLEFIPRDVRNVIIEYLDQPILL